MKDRDFDVIVWGAGPEGVAAALAAAERSGRTLLVDEGPDVGGSAVCGLINSWAGEADTILMEPLRRISRRAWGRMIYEPEELSLVFRKQLAKGAVRLLLGARLVKAKTKGGGIRNLSLATHAGRIKLSAWCYVDASQDYSLARAAKCGFAEDGRTTSLVLLARIGGIDTRVSGVFDADMLNQYRSQFNQETAIDELPAHMSFPSLIPCLRGGTAILNASGDGLPAGDDALERTGAESRCRENTAAAIGFLQRNVPGYENCYLIHHAPQPLIVDAQLPLTREPRGEAECRLPQATEDVCLVKVADGDTPAKLGSLLCRDAGNLVLARTDTAGFDRLPQLFASGEAAGLTAAEALLYDGAVGKLDPERLRRALVNEFRASPAEEREI